MSVASHRWLLVLAFLAVAVHGQADGNPHNWDRKRRCDSDSAVRARLVRHQRIYDSAIRARLVRHQTIPGGLIQLVRHQRIPNPMRIPGGVIRLARDWLYLL